jgi:hypothetical protein
MDCGVFGDGGVCLPVRGGGGVCHDAIGVGWGQAVAGEPFAIEVVVQNRMAEPQTIDSIDISRDYLAAITLEEAVPAFTEALTIPLVGFESFTFLQTIPPNGRTTITLIMSGAEEGTFAGELDVCVNSGNVCQLFPLETTIGAADGR